MSEQNRAEAGPQSATGAQQNARAISDPRDVATVVMARMNMVNTRKDELTIAIKGLSDITQQLARSYAQQLLAIEGLNRRIKELEEAASARSRVGTNGAMPAEPAHNARPQ